MKIVLGLLWARTCGGPTQSPTQAQWGQWRQFVSDAIGHAVWYSQQTGVWVEVWNEPNTSKFWKIDPPSPTNYAATYAYAWHGVQDAEAIWTGANFPVMTAGMGRPEADCTSNQTYINYPTSLDLCTERFLSDVRDTLNSWGGFAYIVEMTGAHIYPLLRANSPQSRAAYSNDVGRQFNQVRRPFPAVQTYMTEAGIRSDYPLNQQAQCDRLLDIYNGWLPSTATKGLIVFRLVDDSLDPNLSSFFHRMGTVRDDWTLKDSYRRLRDLHNGSSGATSC